MGGAPRWAQRWRRSGACASLKTGAPRFLRGAWWKRASQGRKVCSKDRGVWVCVRPSGERCSSFVLRRPQPAQGHSRHCRGQRAPCRYMYNQSVHRQSSLESGAHELQSAGKWIASFYQKYLLPSQGCFTRREIYNNAGRTDEPIPLHSSSNISKHPALHCHLVSYHGISSRRWVWIAGVFTIGLGQDVLHCLLDCDIISMSTTSKP